MNRKSKFAIFLALMVTAGAALTFAGTDSVDPTREVRALLTEKD
jgi:hypothetical protein